MSAKSKAKKGAIVNVEQPATITVTALPPEIIAYAVARPPDDHEVYTLVGLIASEMSHLERALDRIIGRLAGTRPHTTACLTAQYMGAGARLDAICALLTMRNEQDARFKTLLDKLDKLRRAFFGVIERRNRTIHDAWFIDTADAEPAQFLSMPRKALHYGIRKKDRDFMRQTVEKIRDLEKRVNLFDKNIIIALEASRRKPR